MTADLAQLSVASVRLVRILATEGYGPMRPETFGPSGMRVLLRECPGAAPYGSVIVTQADHDGTEWLHASIARVDRMPDYADLVALKAATFGPDRECYQVFPAASWHVNIHAQALHLWGRADGTRCLPDFGQHGTI